VVGGQSCHSRAEAVTDAELKDIRYLASVLKRVEWSGQDGKCPVCRRLKAYGAHPCSCPIRLGQKALARLLGPEVAEPQEATEEVAYFVPGCPCGRDHLQLRTADPRPWCWVCNTPWREA
jgi:hypothetical protein